MTDIEFAKLSGSGNDFLCVDNRDGRFDFLLADPARVGHFARTILAKGLGLGADGVIFACASEVEGFADLSARHFEPDGGEAELCGNGVACFTRWAIENGWAEGDEVKILTTAGVVRGKPLSGGYIRVCIPLPEDLRRGLTLEAAGQTWHYDYCVTGVPHLVTYVADVEAVDIARVGPALRYHPQFRPRGINANFVQVLSPGLIAMRTWEFGVEGETLACGTGSAAAAIMTSLREGWPVSILRGDQPVQIRVRSGDTLRVYFTLTPQEQVTDLCVETVVRFVASGALHPDMVARAIPGGK
jgi:diaminopimelate epimerase